MDPQPPHINYDPSRASEAESTFKKNAESCQCESSRRTEQSSNQETDEPSHEAERHEIEEVEGQERKRHKSEQPLKTCSRVFTVQTSSEDEAAGDTEGTRQQGQEVSVKPQETSITSSQAELQTSCLPPSWHPAADGAESQKQNLRTRSSRSSDALEASDLIGPTCTDSDGIRRERLGRSELKCRGVSIEMNGTWREFRPELPAADKPLAPSFGRLSDEVSAAGRRPIGAEGVDECERESIYHREREKRGEDELCTSECRVPTQHSHTQ
ncbi:unnamed protein product [Pleuronectes platessa]|uniref:Uncharacterized protein n=1 Tax=Pleuronectes platessa TaxID=8262 RepID=A0A9N7YT14_PLEPL|nr:unnamed protein product [Pleuronectes platessa]